MKIEALLVALLLGPAAARVDQEMPIFDTHLHYSHDAWEVVPLQGFGDNLRRAHVRRAMVSSSNNEGTRMLQGLMSGDIVPELRPYRSRGELGTSAHDPTVIPLIEDLLSKRKYVAIGEFHIYGADSGLPNVRRIVERARLHGLFLRSRPDPAAIDRRFQTGSNARMPWTHSGFERLHYIAEHARRSRQWLADLPRGVAGKIGFRNGQRLFGGPAP